MKYKFSIIMAVYNVEKYLEEAVESIINQDIGFKDNIQLILVNDGSPDSSNEICEKYKKMYPENIVYIEQGNQGVSAARNKGLEYIEGEYVNFCDPDDTLNLDVCSKVYNFFKKNKKQIDIVATRVRFFEAREGFLHPLDYKFDKDKVVDLLNDYNEIHNSTSTAFFKNEIIKNEKFDSRIKYGEDLTLVNKLLLQKCKYGILKTAIYNYRRRVDGTSAINNSINDPSWYIETLKYGYLKLFEWSKELYGEILDFIKFLVMYDLQWKIKEKSSTKVLTDEEFKEYINLLKKLLIEIDDYIILQQRRFSSEWKKYTLNLKYDKKISLDYRKGALYYNDRLLYKVYCKELLKINIVDIKKDNIILQGIVKSFLNEEDYKIYFSDDKEKKYELNYLEQDNETIYGFDGGVVLNVKCFKVEIPLKKVKSLRAFFEYKGKYIRKLKLNMGAFTKINFNMKESYYYKNKKIVKFDSDRLLIKHIRTMQEKKEEEKKLLKALWKKKEYSIVFYRCMYYLLRKIYKKPIWIFSDRVNEAKDNGIALYNYVIKHDKNVNAYFVISKKSKDYKKIKKYGKVVDTKSIKHKILMLLAENVISSHADKIVYNIFDNKRNYLLDLLNFNLIFLQHGIIVNDLSKWLNIYNKNLTIFLTSAEREYNSIVNGNYGYDQSVVKLTGLPRHDLLKNRPLKKIILMPTWRKEIVNEIDIDTGMREYNKKFKETEYFKFYNDLINDTKIIEKLKELGYTLEFYIHLSCLQQVNDFSIESHEDIVKINKENFEYSKIFEEGSFMITDYSSVGMEFAYLKKPVIYTQFDIDTFFEGHAYEKGDWDYEKDAFGKVVYTYEDTVEAIIAQMEKGTEVESKYLERINKFYRYFDKNNCKRVYDEIKKISK